MNIELAQMIKEQREKLGMSQRELARQINVNNTLISKIEKGQISKPNIAILLNLSNTLKIAIIDLLDVCDYDINDRTLFNALSFGDTDPTILKDYQDNDKINLDKVVKDYKNNKINEIEAYIIFGYSLGLSLNDINSVAIGMMYLNKL